MIYLENASLYTPATRIDQAALLIDEQRIAALGSMQELTCPLGAARIDLHGLSLVPGFIDLQINGAFGADFTSHPEGIWQAGRQLVKHGVTAFLPTIITSPPASIGSAQDVLQSGPPPDYRGAEVPGLHLEGPYLNLEKRGAHPIELLRQPEPEVYREWSPASHIRLVTLAAGIPGSDQAIRTLVSNGVVVGAGHSQASYAQAKAGIQAGIRYGTHLFNAMPPLDHRNPGLVAALLEDPDITVGMIVDGVHVHPALVRLAWKWLGSERLNLVTDAVAAFGMPKGEYKLGGRVIRVDASSSRLEDGSLAGSLLSLDQALRNLMQFTGCSLEQALPTVTSVPARLLGLADQLGSLQVGAIANLVVLDEHLKVAAVWQHGQPSLPFSR